MRTRSMWRAAVFLALVGCVTEPPERHDWTDQLVADSPCYDANLLDGLDESSTAEEHAVFDCLDATGTLAALRPLDEALDGATRQDAVGLVLARYVNDLPGLLDGASLLGVVEGAVELLDDDATIGDLSSLYVELVYAEPSVDAASLALADPATLDAGLVAPTVRLAGPVVGLLLDEPTERAWVADVLRGELLRPLAWTLAAVSGSSSAPIHALAESWPEHVADALTRVADTSNDRRLPQNSLRGLLSATLGSGGVGVAVRPILEDEVAEAAVRASLAEGVSKGWIDPLPGQVLRLATEDVDGGALADDEPSTLYRLLRLLAHANQPADCSIDLGITSVDFSFGNLAVTLLETFASLDPDSAVSGVDLLGQLLGVSLTSDLLQTVADTGVCPVIDDELVDDLGAIDRLNATPELLRQLISLLGALDDHVADVVDTVTVAYDEGLVDAGEELILDLADAPIAGDLTTLIPALLEPSGYYDLDELPAGSRVLEFEDAWTLAELALADAEHLRTLGGLVNEEDDTWMLLANLARLLDDPEARVRSLLDDVAGVLAEDPDLDAATSLADGLEDDAVSGPLLVLAESEDLRAALLQTSPDAAGPLPWTASLVLDGTLETVVRTLRALRSLLETP